MEILSILLSLFLGILKWMATHSGILEITVWKVKYDSSIHFFKKQWLSECLLGILEAGLSAQDTVESKT